MNRPFGTLDEAFDHTTANNDDLVIVAAGHAENLSAADAVDCDIAGVRIYGLGTGANVPKFTFTGTAGEFVVGAANVYIENVSFVAGISAITMGISIEAAGDDFTIKNCIAPKPTTDSFEFIDFIDVADGANNISVIDCVYYNDEGGTASATFIDAGNGAVGPERLRITGCTIKGGFSEAAIYSDEPCDEVYIANNTIVNHDTGDLCIEFTDAGTGSIVNNRLYGDTYANILDPGSMFCTGNLATTAVDKASIPIPPPDALGSATDYTAEIGDASFWSYVLTKTDGDISDYDDGTDSLEAISDALLAGTGCTAAIDADMLDHLVSTADGTGTYPASVAQESIFAYLMGDDATAVATTYDNTTDSLEAISVALAAGTGCTTAIDADALDHLMTTADGTGAYPASVAQESVFAYLMGDDATAVVTTYDNSTDSLEAISNALAAGTGCTVAIDADGLDRLVTTADGTGVYPTSVAEDSILAKILGDDATAVATTYDNTTDSLEAISNALAAGTGATAAIDADNLDHLASTDTGVAADDDLSSLIVNGSILAHILDSGAAVADYDASTDSLQAIADYAIAGTGVTTAIDAEALDHLIGTADGADVYPASVVQDSILAMIMGDDAAAVASTYNNTTDSLEALGAKTDYIASATLPAAPVSDSLASFIASGGTALGTELYDSLSIVDAVGHNANAHLTTGLGYWQEKTVSCTTTAVGTTDDMFDVGGPIRITSLFGTVTTAASGTVGTMTIIFDSADNDYDSVFSTAVNCDTLGAGDTVRFTSIIDAGVLTITANSAAGQPLSWYCGAGVIEQTMGETGTMGVTWYMTYIPLAAGATVAAST